MRMLVLACAVVAGILIGGWLALTVQDASSRHDVALTTVPAPDAAGPETTPTTTRTTPTPTTTTRTAPVTTPPPLSDQVLLVWTPGRLPDGFSDRVGDLAGVSAVTTVRSGLIHLTASFDSIDKRSYRAPEGYVVPVETMAFDPNTYPDLLPYPDSQVLAELSPDQVVLGSTSARLRGVGPGGELVLEDGTRRDVEAVVDDVMIGGAEAAMSIDAGEQAGLDTARYLLIRYSGAREDVEAEVREELPDGTPVRIRAPGETPVLRHGDAVLPQAMIKDVFGEFAYRSTGGQNFEVDPEWREAAIVTAEVPLLGTLRCHRNVVPALTGAMEELAERNLGSLVQESQGCYNPRFIAGGKGISRHAWGAAVDINIGTNPEGLESIQDPRLVEVMERWGLTSGHEWLIPDPGHFEYVRPPE